MHTSEIEAFVHDNFPEAHVKVQWIDDTSANVVFDSKDLAKEGLTKLVMSSVSVADVVASPQELRTAKALATRPQSMLIVRMAQAGDKKKKNAREASRYYLMNPDQDPTDRMRSEFANGRRRRDNGDYERRRFDDREHRRRRFKDDRNENSDFAASMYDDAPADNGPSRGRDLFADRSRRRSRSPMGRNSDEIDLSASDDDGRLVRKRKGYRDRDDKLPPYSKRDPAPYPKDNTGKELFGGSDRQEGGLHSDRIDTTPKPAERREANTKAAQRMKDHLMSANQTSPRGGHRRSRAMDAKNAEDLSERFGRKTSLSIDSTKSVGNSGLELFPSNGLSIKGSAGQSSGGLSIKGRADVKELFPDRYNSNKNAGRELFDQPVRERRLRQTARDLFD